MPTSHVSLSVHDVWLFVPALNVVALHGVHVASAVLSAESVKYSPAGHAVFLTAHDLVTVRRHVRQRASVFESVMSEKRLQPVWSSDHAVAMQPCVARHAAMHAAPPSPRSGIERMSVPDKRHNTPDVKLYSYK